jgi:L,D-transpeptidase ErfK/SrfK
MKILNNRLISLCLFLMGLAFTRVSFSATFTLPPIGDLIGQMQTTTVRKGESLGDIGRRFDLGVYEMIEANPTIDPWVPPTGAIVVLPTQFILPPGPRVGMILNLAEMRLYYFHPDKRSVTTVPFSIGKKGWSTPLRQTTIIAKKKDPVWVPPASIRAEHLKKGEVLPPFVEGGPDNPMGRYAFYGTEGFRIHGTNRPGGIGVRSSHGCIRLLPEDVETLYYLVPIGTSVKIIHEPLKVGWQDNRLYLEAHQPLTEEQYANSNSEARLIKLIETAIQDSHVVNWTGAKMAVKASRGYPVQID